jgi:hypothetical protein
MPTKPGRGWKHANNYHKRFVNRLGNLTLISKKLNVTNASFTKKKQYYEQSNIELTRGLCSYEKWRKSEIKERQRRLAMFMGMPMRKKSAKV